MRGSDLLTYEQVKELIDLVMAKGVESLEVERAGFKLRIVGKSAAPAPVIASVQSPPIAPAAPAPVAVADPAPESASASAAEHEPAEGPAADRHVLKSPIVGTFYVAPSPEAEPFVKVGDRVSRGQVVCIVEAMKLMNEIEADVDGVIAETLADNAQPVEFGQPLFGIDTDS